jgi:hypothetical protein
MATPLEQNVLEANPREAGTKNQARRVRREGKIPAVVYGAGQDAPRAGTTPFLILRWLVLPSMAARASRPRMPRQ